MTGTFLSTTGDYGACTERSTANASSCRSSTASTSTASTPSCCRTGRSRGSTARASIRPRLARRSGSDAGRRRPRSSRLLRHREAARTPRPPTPCRFQDVGRKAGSCRRRTAFPGKPMLVVTSWGRGVRTAPTRPRSCGTSTRTTAAAGVSRSCRCRWNTPTTWSEPPAGRRGSSSASERAVAHPPSPARRKAAAASGPRACRWTAAPGYTRRRSSSTRHRIVNVHSGFDGPRRAALHEAEKGDRAALMLLERGRLPPVPSRYGRDIDAPAGPGRNGRGEVFEYGPLPKTRTLTWWGVNLTRGQKTDRRVVGDALELAFSKHVRRSAAASNPVERLARTRGRLSAEWRGRGLPGQVERT